MIWPANNPLPEPNTPAPVEPSADTRMGAAATFEQYTALVQAGFSEDHAVYLVGQCLMAIMGGTLGKGE